jgi:hypothetical protein
MLGETCMYNLKTRAVLAGIFIIVAYGVLTSTITKNSSIVMTADIISGLAVIGIALCFYPIFNKKTGPLTLTYLIMKFAEGVLMVIGGVLFLFESTASYRDTIYTTAHVYVFIISAFIFYYLLLITEIVPKFISYWGIAGIFF